MFGIRSHRARRAVPPAGPGLLALIAATVLPLAVIGCEDRVTSTGSGATASTGSDGTATTAPDMERRTAERSTEDPFPPMIPPEGTVLTTFPNNWFFYPPDDPSSMERPPRSQALEGQMAPPLVVAQWYGEPQDLARLRGKIVVIQFWGTHRRATMGTIKENNALVEKYRDQGVVFIGIHDGLEGFEDIAAAIETFEMNYPIGVDDGDASVKNYAVSLWPNYTIIDHWGCVRASGLLTSKVIPVVDTLIEQRKDAAAQMAGGS